MALTADDFIQRFFSPPNLAWPSISTDGPIAATMQPFLQALFKPGECPVILPRRGSNPEQPTAVYVVCWDLSHAGRVRALLEAAVAHHWCHFDGRVARLDPADPVDEAVLDLVGPSTTYILRPTSQMARETFTRLHRLVSTIGEAPLRVANTPRPMGRMLREFDLALAVGAVESSASLLGEIEAYGGISHENVAFLHIRRLAQLGKDQELLANGSLQSLVYAEPPRLVREGVLAAWARVHLDRPLQPDGVDTALTAVKAAKPDVAMLVDESLADTTDAYVSAICALVAIARGDRKLAEGLIGNTTVDAALRGRLGLTPAALDVEALGEAVVVDEWDTHPLQDSDTAVEVEVGSTVVESWLDWVSRLGGPTPGVLAQDQSADWAPAWQVDAELADAIDALPEVATDDLLAGAAAFLDADDFSRPAPQTAAALIRRYLVAQRFSPFDLGAICSLLAVFLRSGPSGEAYREALNDIRAFAPQWVAVGTATRAIDLADVVVCGPVGDNETRSDFIATLLSPLNQQKRRLPVSLLQLAGMVTDDVGFGYDWTIQAVEPEAPVGPVTADYRILLYSLDTSTLSRVSKAIDLQWPGVRVAVSSDKDGTPALKQHARNADLIVLATRRATHAATGFITSNAAGALIGYADGSGSASMLRAVESGIAELMT